MPTFSYVIAGLTFLAMPAIVDATPRSDEVLCEEVAFTVNESVTYGTLTQKQADEITDRCYSLFTL